MIARLRGTSMGLLVSRGFDRVRNSIIGPADGARLVGRRRDELADMASGVSADGRRPSAPRHRDSAYVPVWVEDRAKDQAGPVAQQAQAGKGNRVAAA